MGNLVFGCVLYIGFLRLRGLGVSQAEGNSVFRVFGGLSIRGFRVYVGEEICGPSRLADLGSFEADRIWSLSG